MTFLFGTPTALSAWMTSRTSGIEVTVPGVPDGFTFMATTSDGSKNLAQASFATDSPVSAFMPSSTISRTAGCETRRLTMRAGSGTPPPPGREEPGHAERGQGHVGRLHVDLAGT